MKDLLNRKEFIREKTLFNLMETMISAHSYQQDKLFLRRANQFIHHDKSLQNDVSTIINYGEWLKKKISRTHIKT